MKETTIMKTLLLIFTTILLCTSCEKVIDLPLASNTSKVVIEANITDQAGPYFVKITKSVPFDNASNYPTITNANVTIADNTGITNTLTHIGNGVYATSTLAGVVGRTYTLNVTVDGTTYTAKSTMPAKIPLDSLSYRPIIFGPTTQKTVTPKFLDPIVLGNNYRFVMKVNGVLDKSYFIDNDNVGNGIQYDRPLFSNDIELKTNDIVEIEMQCIDAQAFLYYFTLAEVSGNGPGGGTTPSNPPNGFTNGALGLFSAHTSQKRTIIIP